MMPTSDMDKQYTTRLRPNIPPSAFYVLNILRLYSLCTLIMAIAMSGITIVKSFMETKFYFFDWIIQFIAIVISLFLILSETSRFEQYFQKNWPPFNSGGGLVWVGVLQAVIGLMLLSNLNKPFASKANLGIKFNDFLIAAGVCICVAAAANIIVSRCYIYIGTTGDPVTCRMIRSRRYHTNQAHDPHHGVKPDEESGWEDSSASSTIAVPERTHSTQSSAPNRKSDEIPLVALTRTPINIATTPTPMRSFSPNTLRIPTPVVSQPHMHRTRSVRSSTGGGGPTVPQRAYSLVHTHHYQPYRASVASSVYSDISLSSLPDSPTVPVRHSRAELAPAEKIAMYYQNQI